MNEGQTLLRHILETHHLTPTELSRLAGLRSHTAITRYVGNPADGRFPTRSSMRGETALRIVNALGTIGVPDSLRLAFLSASGHDDFLPLVVLSAAPEAAPTTNSTLPHMPSLTIEDLLQESVRLTQQGQRREALDFACQAQERAMGNLERWAEITLRYCAQYRQQMGQLDQALVDIYAVKRRYLDVVDRPHPGIVALFHAQLGWIADQQRGDFAAAQEAFTIALSAAEGAGDAYLAGQCHHFLVRILSEMAMEKSNTWLGAWPTTGQGISPALRSTLEQAVEHDLPEAERLDPGNIHHHNRHFMAQALIQPREAVSQLRRDEQLYWHHSEHLLALNEARRDVSTAPVEWEAWDAAIAEAELAFAGYCTKRLPQGIAHAAAVWSYAQRRRGLRGTERQAYVDRWVLILLVHPYKTHPLFRIAIRELKQWFNLTEPAAITWNRRYLSELNERVWSREGMFAALGVVDVPLPSPWPREYLREMVGEHVLAPLTR